MLEKFLNFYNYHSDMVLAVGYKIFLAILILIIGYSIACLLNRSIERANNRFDRFDETMVPMLKTVVSMTIYIISGIVIMDIFGVNTNSIIALLGAAGLAIGLALKDTLSNVTAGIILLVLRPFRVGHYIECGTVAGTVKAVTLFATTLETGDGLHLFAPNSLLWGTSIKNFTMNGQRRMDITVGISYVDSIDKAFAVLNMIVVNEKRFLTEPVAQMMLFSLADSAVNIQLRAWTTVAVSWLLCR